MRNILFAMIFITQTLIACPFDEEDSAVTIDAHQKISSFIANNAYEDALIEIENQKALYTYFAAQNDEPIYSALMDAVKNKDAKAVSTWLDRSLFLEIRELVEQVDGAFDNYTKSRLLLVKAKKHLQVLTDNKEAHKEMRMLLKSLGNPGMMGVGKKESDKALFTTSKERLYKLIG